MSDNPQSIASPNLCINFAEFLTTKPSVVQQSVRCSVQKQAAATHPPPSFVLVPLSPTAQKRPFSSFSSLDLSRRNSSLT